MKKSMKKFFSYAFILFAFSITAVLGGFVFNVAPSAKAEESAPSLVTLATPEDLNNYIFNYDSTHTTDNIVLAGNIDMVDQTLDGVIGTAANPFMGTFDGKGYAISNFKISSGSEETDAKHFGLFGVTKGATISNLAITGKLVYTIDKCLNAFVGGVVAQATDTTISNLQITPSQMTITSNYACNMKLGLVAGLFVGGSANYVICRTANMSAISLSGDNNNIYEIGGMFGVFDNSTSRFMVCSVPLNVSATNTFVGKINCGGFAGTIAQGGCEIVNIAMHNTMTTANASMSTANFGQVAGAIANPAPLSGAIAYIHYKDSASLTSRFGSMGSYTYNDNASYDHIAPSTYELNNLTTETGKTLPTYFANQVWHSRYGAWDFAETWYSSAQMINLQSFYGSFPVAFSSAFVESSVLKSDTTLEASYRYGDRVTMEFEFKDVVDGEFSINMSHFYTLDKITRNGVDVATINTITNGEEVSYSVTGSQNYVIEATEGGFAVTVKNVNLATSGEYNITTREKEFKIVAKTKLYDEADRLVEDAEPGYVYYYGTSATTTGLSISSVKYGYVQRIETRIKPNTANAFIGWYLESADGEDIALSTSEVLEINFGAENFTEDVVVYAKYQDNACVVTFTMTEGISRIQFYNAIVETTETGVPVAKTETTLRLEIFVAENFEFDTEMFIAEVANKTNTGEEGFCKLRDTYQTETGEWYYLFALDMTLLEGEYAEAFTIAVQATEIEDKSPSWMWYAIGGGAGALVLAVVIILIVVLKRRGGGGGSYGKAKSVSSTKKGFKNMYY